MKRDTVQTDYSFDYIHFNTTHNLFSFIFICSYILIDEKALAYIHTHIHHPMCLHNLHNLSNILHVNYFFSLSSSLSSIDLINKKLVLSARVCIVALEVFAVQRLPFNFLYNKEYKAEQE
jgi:hypothetical protein